MKLTVVVFIILVVLLFVMYVLTARTEFFHEQSQMSSIYACISQSPFFSGERMKPIDLIARSASSIAEYKQRYMSALHGFSKQDTELLFTHIQAIHNLPAFVSTTYFKTIPWKIINIRQNIELGYPHTHGSCVVFSSNKLNNRPSEIEETLIHEQIHVFQRMFPKKTRSYVTNVLEFTDVTDTIGQDKMFSEIWSMTRNNPDIDRVYAWRNRWIPMQLYITSQPHDISESSVKIYDMETQRLVQLKEYDAFLPDFVKQREHPYEIMAVILAHMLYNNYKNESSTPILEKTRVWMRQSL